MYMYGNKNGSDKRNDEKLKDFVRYRNTSIILCIFLFIGFLMFSKGNSRETIYVEPGDEALLIRHYQEGERSVLYETLIQVELTDTIDFGEMIDGTDTPKGTSGLWKNEVYGEYYLYTTSQSEDYIILTATDQTVVFNYENTSVTDDIFSAFQTLMKEKYPDYSIAFINSTANE